MNSSLEGQESVSGIRHFEDAAKPVFRQIPDLQYLQLWWNRTEIEFCNDDIVDDDGRLWRLIESRREKVLGASVKIRVRGQRRPVEVEGHRESLRKTFLSSRDRSGLVSVMGDSRPPETSMNGEEGIEEGKKGREPRLSSSLWGRGDKQEKGKRREEKESRGSLA